MAGKKVEPVTEPELLDTDAIDREIDRMVALAEDADFEGRTLKSDIRDHMLEVRKSSGKPWSELLEGDQKRLAQGFEHLAAIIIRRVTLVVVSADAEGRTVQAILKSYGEDGGFKISATATSDSDTALALHGMVKQPIIIRLADPTSKVATDADIDADQAGLKFEGETDDVPGDEPTLEDDDITRQSQEGDRDLAGD